MFATRHVGGEKGLCDLMGVPVKDSETQQLNVNRPQLSAKSVPVRREPAQTKVVDEKASFTKDVSEAQAIAQAICERVKDPHLVEMARKAAKQFRTSLGLVISQQDHLETAGSSSQGSHAEQRTHIPPSFLPTEESGGQDANNSVKRHKGREERGKR